MVIQLPEVLHYAKRKELLQVGIAYPSRLRLPLSTLFACVDRCHRRCFSSANGILVAGPADKYFLLSSGLTSEARLCVPVA